MVYRNRSQWTQFKYFIELIKKIMQNSTILLELYEFVKTKEKYKEIKIKECNLI